MFDRQFWGFEPWLLLNKRQISTSQDRFIRLSGLLREVPIGNGQSLYEYVLHNLYVEDVLGSYAKNNDFFWTSKFQQWGDKIPSEVARSYQLTVGSCNPPKLITSHYGQPTRFIKKTETTKQHIEELLLFCRYIQQPHLELHKFSATFAARERHWQEQKFLVNLFDPVPALYFRETILQHLLLYPPRYRDVFFILLWQLLGLPLKNAQLQQLQFRRQRPQSIQKTVTLYQEKLEIYHGKTLNLVFHIDDATLKGFLRYCKNKSTSMPKISRTSIEDTFDYLDLLGIGVWGNQPLSTTKHKSVVLSEIWIAARNADRLQTHESQTTNATVQSMIRDMYLTNRPTATQRHSKYYNGVTALEEARQLSDFVKTYTDSPSVQIHPWVIIPRENLAKKLWKLFDKCHLYRKSALV